MDSDSKFIGHLYRYPHPFKLDVWLYVGQGLKRDRCHRKGRTAFGRWFKDNFLGIILPQPILWDILVESQRDLSEEETIAVFQYHTWHGMGGRNMVIPVPVPVHASTRQLHKKMNHRIEAARRGRQFGLQAKEQRLGIFAVDHSRIPCESNTNIFCKCGCGNLVSINKWNDTKTSYIKGQPREFISGHNTVFEMKKLQD